MKRVKRLFACLLALTMMLGLSATAFATETAEKFRHLRMEEQLHLKKSIN